MLLASNFTDYKILDSGDGEKLESISGYIVSRPDSQVIWSKEKPHLWKGAYAIYHRSQDGGGHWQYVTSPPKINFTLSYKDLKFAIELTNFKHIGIFPEQSCNWDFLIEKISNAKSKNVRVLNLFAYTGGATVACAYAGASEIVHVDASKRIISIAKKNINLNNLQDKVVRFIVEDVMKFVMRELRRGRKYDIIIMDPPVYGRGPDGEMWQIENSLSRLVNECIKLLSANPLLFLISCYTAGFSHISLKNMLLNTQIAKYGGVIESSELGIPIENSNLILPCGICSRFYL